MVSKKNKISICICLFAGFTLSEGMYSDLGRRLLAKVRQTVERHPVASAAFAVGSVVIISKIVRAYMAERNRPVGVAVNPTPLPAVDTATLDDAQGAVDIDLSVRTPVAPVNKLTDSAADAGVPDIISFLIDESVKASGYARAKGAAHRELADERAGVAAAEKAAQADADARAILDDMLDAELAEQAPGIVRESYVELQVQDIQARQLAQEQPGAQADPLPASQSLMSDDGFTLVEHDPDCRESDVSPSTEAKNVLLIEESKKRGGKYLAQLWLGLPGLTIPTPDASSYKAGDAQFVQAVIDIIWYLYEEAAQKGEGFDEGTFILKDPDFRLFNTLLQYVKLCDPTTWEKEKYHSECYAYCRASSHLKEYYTATNQEKLHHYGIYPSMKGLTPLPAHKQHIFFGMVDPKKQLIFIKPENAGLSTQEITRHIAELARSIAVKAIGSQYDDAPNFRKERVPSALRKAFIAACPQEKLKFEGLGIQHMVQIGLMHENKKLQQLARECHVRYDHIPLRMGREVIITPQDIILAVVHSMHDVAPEAEVSTMEAIYDQYMVTKQCIRALKQGAEVSKNKESLREAYKKLEALLCEAHFGGPYSQMKDQLSRYCALLDIFYYAASDSALIENFMLYEYLLEDVFAQELPRCLRENIQRRELLLSKRAAVTEVGMRCQEYIDAVIAKTQFKLNDTIGKISPEAHAILVKLFDEYDGVRKVLRDSRSLGVIDDALRPDEEHFMLTTIVTALKERLVILAQRFDTTQLDENNALLSRVSTEIVDYFMSVVRTDLLRICGKKSTRDAHQYHARVTHDLQIALQAIVDEAGTACTERLFGKADALIQNSPRTQELDERQFREHFQQAFAQDKEIQRMVIEQWIMAFSKEESFIDCAESEEVELQKLMQKRCDSFALLCSKEAGALTIYTLEQAALDYELALKAKLMQVAPLASDAGTTALAMAGDAMQRWIGWFRQQEKLG